jgi:hypothetical protein
MELIAMELTAGNSRAVLGLETKGILDLKIALL